MHYHIKGKNYEAPSRYTDLEGNSRSFTYVNHDGKTSIWTGVTKVVEENKPIEINPDHQLCKKIIEEGLGEDGDFINDYDLLLSEFGIKRFYKGTPLYVDNIIQDSYKEDGYYVKLEELWNKYKTP
jgi:hypothetical protein